MSIKPAALPLGRDRRVIGLIGIGHGFSHFYQLALPPLFPLMHLEEGWSYTQLGMLIAVLYAVSGVLQPVAGFVVDRVGARIMLYIGLAVCASSTALTGVVDSYFAVLGLVVAVGIGNSVFHPCDYTILTHNVSDRRIGRGFSFHAFAGYGGYAASPVAMIWLATHLGWREALLTAGLTGIVFLTVMIAAGHPSLKSDEPDGGEQRQNSANLLFSPLIIACFVFFCVTAMGQIGLQTFTASALLELFQTPVTLSNTGLSLFMLGTAFGVIAGGFVADKTKHHRTVTALCLIPPSILSLLPGLLELGSIALCSTLFLIGFSFGVLIPSRDMVVRAATPRYASGRVFGVVYSGLDVGGALTPVAFGWLIDLGHATWTFFAVGTCFAMGMLVMLRTGRGTAQPG